MRLSPALAPGRRIYAVGDIHGRFDLLSEIFARIDAHKRRFPSDDTLEIFLGDYVDRGPASYDVVQGLIERAAAHPSVHLLGNHEAILLASARDAEALATWCRIGALATLKSYGVAVPAQVSPETWPAVTKAFETALPSAHRAFFMALRPSYTSGDYFFVHAGIRPGVPLAAQRTEDLIWIREPFLSSQRDHGCVVVHGHTPSGEPEFLPNRINIDTGAYATGRLTCLVLQDTAQDILD